MSYSLKQEIERSAEETFLIEIDSWSYAIKHFKNNLNAGLVRDVIKEMSGTFLNAIRGGYAFNLLSLAAVLAKASDRKVEHKELVFYIFAHLPNPAILSQEELEVLSRIVSEASAEYPALMERYKVRLVKKAG